MKLTVISDEINVIKKSGFAYLFENGDRVGYGTDFPEHFTLSMIENYPDQLSDNDAVLCIDENGDYYGAVIGYNGDCFVPVVWQRLYKTED